MFIYRYKNSMGLYCAPKFDQGGARWGEDIYS